MLRLKKRLRKDFLKKLIILLLLLSNSYFIGISYASCTLPTVNDTSRCGEGNVTMEVNGSASLYNWYDRSADGTFLGSSGNYFETSFYSSSDSIYVAGVDTQTTNDYLSFDGINDYVAINSMNYASTILTELTVEAWIRTSDATDQIIASFDRNEYWRLEINGSAAGAGQIGFGIFTDVGQLDFSSVSRVDDGDWHHIAVVYDEGFVGIYIDGNLDNSTSFGTQFGTGTTRYGFVGTGSEAAAYNGSRGPNDYFNGDLDEVRIWSLAKSEAQINNQMTSCLNGRENGLDLYYAMDGSGTDTQVADKTDNNHQGSLQNFTFPGAWNNDGRNINACIVCESNRVGAAIAILETPQPFLGNDTCIAANTHELSLSGSYSSYLWSDLSTNTTLTVNESGTFYVEVDSSFNSCQGSDTIQVTLTGVPTVSDTTICSEGTVSLNASSPTGLVKWFNSNSVDSFTGRGIPFVRSNITSTDTFYVASYDTTQNSSAVQLDGVDDYMAIQEMYYDSTNYEAITVETWIKTNNDDQMIASFDRSEYWRLEIGGVAANGYIGFGINTDQGILDFSSNSRVDDNTWHHIAVVFNSGALEIYIDGQLDASTSLGSTFGSGMTRYGFIGIGSEASTFDGGKMGNYFEGSIDEFRIWNKAKTAQEIVDQMNACLLNNDPQLQLYYAFNENSGTLIHNYFSTQNKSTLQNTNLSNIWTQDAPEVNGCESLCKSDFERMIVVKNVVPQPELGDNVCSSDGYTLSAPAGYSGYLWSTGSTDSHIQIDSTGFYSVTVDSAGSICSGSDRIYVSILSKPVSNDTTQCGPGNIQLQASGSSGNYFWYNTPGLDSLIATGSVFTPYVSQTDTFYLSSFENDTTNETLSFDGIDDYVALDMQYSSTIPTLTVEAWVKTDVSGVGQNANWAIIDFDRSEYFNLSVRGDDGRVSFSTTDENNITDDFYSNASTPVNDDQWHHIAAVYNGTDKLIYIDGVLSTTQPNPHAGAALGSGNARYGYLGDGSESSVFNGTRNELYFEGQLDEVRIWHEARNILQIQEQKNYCLNGTENNLMAYYKMKDINGGTTLTDYSNNGHDGTLFNMNNSSWSNSNQTILCSCGESDSDTVIVAINPVPNVDLGNDTCVISPLELNAGSGFSSYQWKDNSTASSFTASVSEAVWVTVDSTGTPCSGSDTVIVSVGAAAAPTPNDNGVCGSGTVTLTAEGVGTNRWWDQSTGGTLLATGDTFTTPPITMNTDYYVSSNLASPDALSFNGTSDQVAIQDHFYQTTELAELSIEMWIRTNDGSDQIIASFDRSEYWRLEINGSSAGIGQVGVGLRTDAGILDFGSVSRVDDGQWHHVAAVYDNGDLSIYIDGNLDDSTSMGSLLGSGLTRYGFIGIGSEATAYDGSANGSHFNGDLDEFRLWHTARTLSEIRDNQDECLNGSEPGLIINLRMDEGSGTALRSVTGTGDGVISGANWISDGELFNCSACGESNRVAVQASIYDEIDSVDYDVSYPGDAGTYISMQAFGGSGQFDYRETSGVISFSGNYQSGENNLLVPNGGVYDFEIIDENGCSDNVENISTRPAPVSGNLVQSNETADSLEIPGVNNWFYVTNTGNELLLAINPNGNDLGTVNADVFVNATAANYNGEALLGRSLVVNPEYQPLSNVSIRLYFSDAEMQSLNDTIFSYNGTTTTVSNLLIEKYTGPTEDSIYDPSDAVSLMELVQSSNDVQFGANYLEFNSSSFSEFWIKDGTAGLPIELLFFRGQKKQNQVDLHWATATEINNDYFTIERSIDGNEIEVIGEVLGAGNSIVEQHYQWVDEQPRSGVNYYRLKQTDFDGQFEYTDWIEVDFSTISDESIKIYPNPNSGQFNLELKGFDFNEEVNVQVYDIKGQMHLNQKLTLMDGFAHENIRLRSDLPKGIYFVKCEGGDKHIIKRMVTQ